MDLASIFMPMDQSTMANGMKTSSTAKGKKSGLMELSSRALTRVERRKASENLPGQMVQSTKVNSQITASMVPDSTGGQMAEHTMDSGSKM